LIRLPLVFINISCTFIDASAGARHLSHGCVATLERRENCLRVAPCREPNDKLSLVAFEGFTTLACAQSQNFIDVDVIRVATKFGIVFCYCQYAHAVSKFVAFDTDMAVDMQHFYLVFD